MSPLRPSNVLMIGLPQSGKTTFLAALWHIVGEPDLSIELRLKELRGDRGYLNRIRDSWLSCSPLERTTLQNEQLVTLCLESRDGNELELTMPDMSGEAFELQLRERRWSVAYDELVQGASGVLLFIHPDGIRPAHRVDLANRMEAQIRAVRPTAPSETPAPSSSKPWSHELIPTQVQLVELLQFLLQRVPDGFPLRVAVTISAWDLIADVVSDPEAVIREKLPLLWQFIHANPRSIDHVVVGVSAQGGDLERDRESLLQRDTPAGRVRVVGLDCEPYDLTAPVAWLVE